MKMTNKKLSIILLMFLVFVAAATTVTFAWLSVGDKNDVDLNLGTFTLETTLKDSEVEANVENGIYILNGLSEDEHNLYDPENLSPLVENLNISVKVTAEIAGYLRVKVLNEWIVTKDYRNFDRVVEEIIYRDEASYFPFVLAEGWYYDTTTQYCYYTEIIDEGFTGDIPFITAGSPYVSKTNSSYIETCKVTLSVGVQIVQANRFEAIWGIASIPTGKEV